MAMAYHWDALRKQRVLDRKNEAIQRMTVAGSENPVPSYITAPNDPMDNLKSVDPEQFNNIRSVKNWMGRERNRREFNHSRDGPLIPSSWQQLGKEYNSRKDATPILDRSGHPVSFTHLVMNQTKLT